MCSGTFFWTDLKLSHVQESLRCTPVAVYLSSLDAGTYPTKTVQSVLRFELLLPNGAYWVLCVSIWGGYCCYSDCYIPAEYVKGLKPVHLDVVRARLLWRSGLI